MKASQIIFISQQGWTRLADGQASTLQPWSDVTGSALVVFDLPESELGLRTAKGRADFAAAQIEKSVRSDGMLDGPLKVFIHQQIRYADSSQALYTALPLELWQQLEAWCERQPDHCLPIPMGALLAAKSGDKSGDEHCKILRVGSQLHAFAATKAEMHYATSAALGGEASNFVAPVRTLFEQLKAAGWSAPAKPVSWGALLCTDMELERSSVMTLMKSQGLQANVLPHETFKQNSGGQIFSALPAELNAAESKAIEAPLVSKMAWLSEVYMTPLTAMVAAVALGLGGYAFFTQYTAATETQQAEGLKSEVEALRLRATAASQLVAAGPDAASAAFLKQIGFSASHNPVTMLATLRQAAGQQVRIQRLQLVKPDQAANPVFRVDGVVTDGSSATLGRFLADLKAKGWQPEATTPNDNAFGAFAYLLKPVVAVKAS